MAPTAYVLTCNEFTQRNRENIYNGCEVILVTTSEEHAKEVWNEETEACQEKGEGEFDPRTWINNSGNVIKKIIYQMHLIALD